MKMYNSRSIQGLLLVWLMAAPLILVACSHWDGQERFAAGRGRTHHLARSDMDHFVDSIRYQHADAGDHYRLGRYFQQRGRHLLAITEFSRTVRLDPRRADAFNAMGVSYDQLHQFDLAEQCYRQAQVLKPDFAAAYNNLGYSYLMQDKPEKAVAPLEKAVSLQDRNARFHNNLALAYRQTAQVEKAAAEFKLSGQEQQIQTLAPEPPASVLIERTQASRPMEDPGEKEPPTPFPDTLKSSEIALPLMDESRQADSVEIENMDSGTLTGQTETLPHQVTPQIEIANGNGAYKMARNIGNYFKYKGFDVQRLSNADHFKYPRTRIFYSDGQRQVACTLSQLLFGPEMVCDLIYNGRNQGQIKILIGNDVADLNSLFSGKLKIRVANGNGVRDMAGKLSNYLRTKGFYVVRPVNAGNFGYEFTQIYYPAGRLANARFVTRELPESDTGRLIEDDRQSDTIYIIIGKDFTIL